MKHALLESLFQDHIERFQLPNGMTVLLKQDASAKLVSTQVWVNTGSIHEDRFLGSGISHYVEHMLFKGTKRRSYKEISDEVQAKGGSVNAYTSFDRTVYHIDGPSEALENALDVLEDIVFHSTFDPKEVASEQGVIQREIDMGHDDPYRELQKALFETAYRDHPYRYPVIGYRELFDEITREDLWEYYKGRYVPNNMVLTVVGAIDITACRTLVEQFFGQHKRGYVTPCVLPEENTQLAPRECRLHGDYHLTHGAVTYKVPGLRSEDAPAFDMLAGVLGQGHSSLLWQRLRVELGLVHHIDASVWNPGETGLFWISYLCEPENRERVEAEVQAVVDELVQEAPAVASLDKVRRQALVGEVNNRKTMSGQASRLGIAEVVVGDLAYKQIYFKRLDALTPACVQRVAAQYCRESCRCVATLEPKCENSVARPLGEEDVLPDFEEICLSNGVRVLFQPCNTLPKIHLRAVGLGGALYEDLENKGVTGVLATLLTKDTERHSAQEIAQKIESVGGSFSEMAGNNSFGVHAEVLPEDFPLALEIVADALTIPAFKEEVIAQEVEAQIAQIKEEEDDILDAGVRALRKQFFGEHPYATCVLGTLEALESLTSEHVRAHFEKLVDPRNIVISVAGAFEREALIGQLQSAFEKMPKRSFEKKECPFVFSRKGASLRIPMDREQAVVLQAYPGSGVQDEDYFVAEVLDALLSGMSSQLFQVVREEKGLAYYVGASRVVGLQSGMFYLYAGTGKENVQEVAGAMDAELSRVRNGGVRSEELSCAKAYLKALKRMSLQAPGSRAVQAALNALYDLPINEWREYDQKIDAVTAEAIQDFAKKHLVKAHALRLVVFPE